jgi:hypothetical protein
MSGAERREAQEIPRRLMMIGYDSVEKLVADGQIRLDDLTSLELQFNFGKMFDEVLYIVPFGRKTQERRISDTRLKSAETRSPGRATERIDAPFSNVWIRRD